LDILDLSSTTKLIYKVLLEKLIELKKRRQLLLDYPMIGFISWKRKIALARIQQISMLMKIG
jgi:hypothetical protein